MVKIVFAILSIIPLTIFSQVIDPLETIIERYLENVESTADYTQIVDDLKRFESNPMNVNTASVQELVTFPFFSSTQAAFIARHRNRFGNFIDMAELQVLGFSPVFIQFMMPYLSVRESEIQSLKNLAKMWDKGKGEFSFTSGKKSPALVSSYEGNLWSQQLRLRYKVPGVLSVSLNTDKDPGEVLYRKSNPAKGLEFLSGHVSIHNIGHINDFVLGDYVLQVGEGLVMGSGIGIGKSANVMSLKRGGTYIRPYRGINEFLFHRGAATAISLGKFTINMAFAKNRLDAALSRDTLESNESFTSVDLDGLHRTPSELEKKGQLEKQLVHTGISFAGKKGSWGTSYTGFKYSSSLQKADKLYAIHRPEGTELNYVNLYQSHVLGNVLVFSEWAYGLDNSSYALAAGALTSIAPKLDVGLHFRDASENYLSPNSTAFAATSSPERGLYFSSKINFNRRFALSMYKDVFKNKWLGFGKSNIYTSNDLLLQLDMKPNRKTHVYLRGRSYDKFRDDKSGEFLVLNRMRIKQFRIHFQSDLTKHFKFETRGEWNISQSVSSKNRAALVYLDFKRKFSYASQSLAARYSVFNIPDFNARIFAFEDQIQYLFSIAGYYGRGHSFYLVYSAKPTRKIKVSARYGLNQYENLSGKKFERTSLFLQFLYRI